MNLIYDISRQLRIEIYYFMYSWISLVFVSCATTNCVKDSLSSAEGYHSDYFLPSPPLRYGKEIIQITITKEIKGTRFYCERRNFSLLSNSFLLYSYYSLLLHQRMQANLFMIAKTLKFSSISENLKFQRGSKVPALLLHCIALPTGQKNRLKSG